VFGNYRGGSPSLLPEDSDPTWSRQGNSCDVAQQGRGDAALARAFIYSFLAQAYQDPTPEIWRWIGSSSAQQSLRSACKVAVIPVLPADSFSPDEFDSYHMSYLAVFGHAARGSCPLNEVEYGDLNADPLFQPHRLADLAAFYRACDLEVADDAGERHDHLCLQLEFMCVLAAKEAWAVSHELETGHLASCRDMERKFLRKHLGRWTPAFCRRLGSQATHPALRALAEFTRVFVEAECLRFNVQAGSQDLLLRPVDEAAETMCGSCALSQFPPGAGVVR
jgi:DMSO reductase family type II enzyme chaperone